MKNIFKDALSDFKNGKMIILTDDEDRENEGDIVIAAEYATPEIINFMITHARGLVCVPLKEDRIEELNLNPMVYHNTDRLETGFTVSVDYKNGTTTGISAYDRSKTIQALISKKSKSLDFTKPGHIFPLKSKKGGVLVRAGHTEAAIDLCEISNLYPAGVICEIIRDDGHMAKLNDLKEFAKKHEIKIISIRQIIEYRRKKETLIQKESEANLPTEFGLFRIISYSNKIDSSINVALTYGNIEKEIAPIIRIHSECLTGDVFFSSRCDCGNQLRTSLKKIAEEGVGICLYMKQEGRGIGLHNKIKAYALQDTGYDTVEANQKLGFKSDLRDYGLGAQILKNLGVKKMRLLTNNPKKVIGIKGYNLDIVEILPIQTIPSKNNKDYLLTKKIN